jgi:hypothetical protein
VFLHYRSLFLLLSLLLTFTSTSLIEICFFLNIRDVDAFIDSLKSTIKFFEAPAEDGTDDGFVPFV